MTTACAHEVVLPASVRYVKNGSGGKWWPSARSDHQVHLGWPYIPGELLIAPDFAEIELRVREHRNGAPGATQDFNQLRNLLDRPSRHVWVTFEDGCMWWCTVLDGAVPNPAGKSATRGHFSLNCARPWSNRSLNGALLAISDLPGSVTSTAGFRDTVCKPKNWPGILRIIRDQQDPDAVAAATARHHYEQTVHQVIRRLSPKDFEQLIDLILAGTGWARISTLGGTREGIDIEAENPAADEIAFVQVKSSARQTVLNEYVGLFQQRRGRYARMIFAVHSPDGTLTPPSGLPVHLWAGEKVAQLVVRLGLGEWAERRLA